MLRKINSPSRPASQALISASTSLRLMSFFSTFSRFSVLLNRLQIEMRRDDRQMLERPLAARGLDAFRRHNVQQMADRRREDVLVASRSSRPAFLKPPSALAMSPATDGFSAMMSVLPICCPRFYTGRGKHAKKIFFVKSRFSLSAILRPSDGRGCQRRVRA